MLATQVCISILIKLSTYLSFMRSEGHGLVVDNTMCWQEEKDGAVPRVLQSYTAEKLSSFGELALMCVIIPIALNSCSMTFLLLQNIL